MKKLAAAAAALTAAAGSWAVIENTLLLRTAAYTVDMPGLPRLVQISDLHRRHFGRAQHDLIRTVAAAKPEIIVITGDLISRSMTDFSGTSDLLRRLRALAPVYMVYGNHELDLLPETEAEYRAMLRRAGVRLLDNEMIALGGITLAGLTLTVSHYRGGAPFGFRGAVGCTADDLHRIFGECPENTVLLAHSPLFFDAYAAWGARLTLSGHIHGGIVRLPGVGGLLSPERRFLPKWDKGRFMIGASEMIVSGGLGKLRFGNPPEICVIESGGADRTAAEKTE